MPENTILCWTTKTTVADYRAMVKERNRAEIATFILARFTERYVTPLEAVPAKEKSGFCIMAICCLMIETLESFWRGWPNTRRKEEAAFCYFFSRNDNFKAFRPHSEAFYKNIRCAILHQGETTGGWTVVRAATAPLLNSNTINATKFHRQLVLWLKEYCSNLEKQDWNSDIWIRFRNKMDVICNNCG